MQVDVSPSSSVRRACGNRAPIGCPAHGHSIDSRRGGLRTRPRTRVRARRPRRRILPHGDRPGFLTQTSVFTAQLGSSFGFAILISVLFDLVAQFNRVATRSRPSQVRIGLLNFLLRPAVWAHPRPESGLSPGCSSASSKTTHAPQVYRPSVRGSRFDIPKPNGVQVRRRLQLQLEETGLVGDALVGEHALSAAPWIRTKHRFIPRAAGRRSPRRGIARCESFDAPRARAKLWISDVRRPQIRHSPYAEGREPAGSTSHGGHMPTLRAVVSVAWMGTLTGCAGMRGAATSDSGGSSAGSGQSSAGSGQSSAGSGQSTQNLGPSTQGALDNSGNSAQGTVDATAGTGQSTGQEFADSTRQSSASTAQSTRATTGPLLSTVALGGTLAGIGAIIWAVQAPAAATPAAAQAFLRARERQLRQDLAIGAGPAIEDLADAARIHPSNLSRFGRLLRQNRAELPSVIEPGAADPARAVEALQRIGAIVRQDPAIAADSRAFAAELHGG